MSNNEPVYKFKYYKMIKASYINNDSNIASKVSLVLSSSKYDEKTKEYRITINVSCDFKQEEESIFVYQAFFDIQDEEWLKEVGKKIVNSLFFSTVFPFIRTQLFNLTSDSRGGVLIPTIDLRNTDVEKGIVLTRIGK